MKWAQLQRVFGKRRLQSIKVIEYIKDGYIIRMSDKLDMEMEIMSVNEHCFKLAYSSSIFDNNIIQQIG